MNTKKKLRLLLLQNTSPIISISSKKILIHEVRMARSPLAEAVLPPPQKFMFLSH